LNFRFQRTFDWTEDVMRLKSVVNMMSLKSVIHFNIFECLYLLNTKFCHCFGTHQLYS